LRVLPLLLMLLLVAGILWLAVWRAMHPAARDKGAFRPEWVCRSDVGEAEVCERAPPPYREEPRAARP
jgi:hypothetical protein